MVGLAATSALASVGVGMEFNQTNSEQKQLETAEQRISGLSERAAQRLQNESSPTVDKSTAGKSGLGHFNQDGAILLN